MRKYFLILTSLLLIHLSCQESSKGQLPEFDVKISRDTTLFYTSYAIVDSMGALILKVHQNDLNRGVIQYRYKGKAALDKRMARLQSLFKTIFSDSSIDFDFSTIAWGRLSDGFNRDHTLSKRMVLYAKKSEKWDAGAGVPFDGNANEFVKSLKDVFSVEIDGILNKYNYKVESISAEKVLIGSAENLPYWDEVKTELKPYDKLPYDCQLWFILQKTK